MGNVNLPAPVAYAGGALCLLAGYLIGVVAGPEPSGQTTAEVVSFEPATDALCLTGEAVADEPSASGGLLCGTWRQTEASSTPREGDAFRFVTLTSQEGESGSDGRKVTFIYGDVVR